MSDPRKAMTFVGGAGYSIYALDVQRVEEAFSRFLLGSGGCDICGCKDCYCMCVPGDGEAYTYICPTCLVAVADKLSGLGSVGGGMGDSSVSTLMRCLPDDDDDDDDEVEDLTKYSKDCECSLVPELIPAEVRLRVLECVSSYASGKGGPVHYSIKSPMDRKRLFEALDDFVGWVSKGYDEQSEV